MIGRGAERGSGRSVVMVRDDDDDDMYTHIYILDEFVYISLGVNALGKACAAGKCVND